MHCVVTGGAGFIGSHLTERLLTDGHQVVVLDDFSTGRRENLASIEGRDGLQVHEVDITNSARAAAVVAGADWVFHLAALADIVPSIERPADYHRVNVNGTLSILEAARAADARRFIYAASSSCYGIPETYPTPESAALQPQYPYALTKCLGEQYVLHWNQVYGLPAVSLRLFNVYGPRVRTSGTYGAVFGVFLAQKLAGRPFTVVGDGTQTRDFTYVADVVDAFVGAAASDIEGAALNVGSGEAQSVNRLVELLGGEAIHIPKRPGEPDRTLADTTRIRTLLDWQTQVPFADGVGVMVDNIEDWRTAPVWTGDSIAEATAGWFRYLGGART